MEYFSEYGYTGLFLAAFFAATILPLSSEIVLTALLLSGMSPAALVVVATAGNVLGSLVNYALGCWMNTHIIRNWLRLSETGITNAEVRFKKYGIASLLFAWVPIIGDPLTVVAGVLRIRLLWFVVLVTSGKLLRYVVVSLVVLQAG